jgi:prophage antirepressor-like protein
MIDINQFLKEILTYEGKKIKMEGSWEEPWFCGRDVCEVLGYSSTKKAIHDHVHLEDKMSLYELKLQSVPADSTVKDPWVDTAVVPTPEFNNETKACYISETGLYDLASKSHLPTAKKFQRWITKEVLPALRRQGQYNVSTSQADIDQLTREFEEQLRLKDEQIMKREDQIMYQETQYQESLHYMSEELDETREGMAVLKNIIANEQKRPVTQIIYIATSDLYARRNRFKVGGVKSGDLLESRLKQYNTRSANGDMFRYVAAFHVADFKHAEIRIKDILGKFTDKEGKEFYQLHFTHLERFVQIICEHYTDEVSELNDHLESLIATISNTRKHRPIVPPSINYASLVVIRDGVPENKVFEVTTDQVAFIDLFREYLEGLPRPINSLVRTDIFDNIPIKVNKTKAWSWIKKEVGDYDPDLMEKLQYYNPK